MTEGAKRIPMIPHIHNGFGQASMAVCAAVLGGAGGVDVAMNGIAIHSGLAALEEVVMSLELLYGIPTNIKKELLTEYSRVVSRHTGIPVHPNKPIVGSETFMCDMENFVTQVLEARDGGTERTRPFAPSMVGGAHIPVWGANTMLGPATKIKLRQLGLSHDPASVEAVLNELKRQLSERTEYPRYLTESEVEEVGRRVLTAE